jgi:hypothetical protein
MSQNAGDIRRLSLIQDGGGNGMKKASDLHWSALAIEAVGEYRMKNLPKGKEEGLS